MQKAKKKLNSSRTILLGFAIVIIVGTLLLTLPFATNSKTGASFSDALFTATSAVCVTGLVVKDTATYWSLFGQIVILILIQIGGMGVITILITLTLATGKKISLSLRGTMQEAISGHQVGGIVGQIGFILLIIAIVEVLGAIIMAPAFCMEFGVGKGIWYAIFHSVSALCNAGFDLMGTTGEYSSLSYFSSHPAINLTIMFLIVFGGIGFITWCDMREHRFKLRKYRMQSKVILVTTAFLILLPAIYFFIFEFSNLSLKERIWQSLFQSVTLRTAGFSTADLTVLSEIGIVISIFLMLIGGAPGSTAGGMKTTTFSVLLLTAGSAFNKGKGANVFGRRISDETIRMAVTILTIYLTLCVLGAFIISGVENLPLLHCLYETASAIGTVGLSLGITPNLNLISRGVLIALMYIGRVGGLTILFSAFSNAQNTPSKLPQEKITVG